MPVPGPNGATPPIRPSKRATDDGDGQTQTGRRLIDGVGGFGRDDDRIDPFGQVRPVDALRAVGVDPQFRALAETGGHVDILLASGRIHVTGPALAVLAGLVGLFDTEGQQQPLDRDEAVAGLVSRLFRRVEDPLRPGSPKRGSAARSCRSSATA